MSCCAKCEKDLAPGEGHSITTEQPSKFSPGDGFDLCDTCWDDEEERATP